MWFQTRRSDWGFIVPATFVWISALILTLWDFVYLQGMVYRLTAAGVAGFGLCVTGFSMRRVAKRTLGEAYSYGLRTYPEQRLVKHGIYGRIRHPAYLASILYNPGISLVFSSLLGSLLMLGFIPLVLYRMSIEESMLTERFGEEYQRYMEDTWRLIPFVY